MIIVCYSEIPRTVCLSCKAQFKSMKDSPLLKVADINGKREKIAHC